MGRAHDRRSDWLPQPLEPVEDDVEGEREFEVRVAGTEAAVVRGGERHLGDMRKGRAELIGQEDGPNFVTLAMNGWGEKDPDAPVSHHGGI